MTCVVLLSPITSALEQVFPSDFAVHLELQHEPSPAAGEGQGQYNFVSDLDLDAFGKCLSLNPSADQFYITTT